MLYEVNVFKIIRLISYTGKML